MYSVSDVSRGGTVFGPEIRERSGWFELRGDRTNCFVERACDLPPIALPGRSASTRTCPSPLVPALDMFLCWCKPNIELELNSEIVLVALNFSVSGVVIRPFQNFHGTGGGAYKIRYALQDTPFWGAYMTDIIKDFPEKESGKMMSYLRKNRSFEEENANRFRKELQDLGSTISTLVAFGNDVFSILNRNFMGEFNVLKVPHYSAYTNKETYREQVQEAMAKFG